MNLISRIFLYFFGTITLKLSGEYCERLLNILAFHHISFWKPIRKKEFFYITVMRKDIKKIRDLRRNTGVRIKIVKKSGFPLVYNKYKHRYGLIFGLILFVILINILSTRMWMIKVNGNINVTDEEIYSFFETCGVYHGITMKKINSDILKQQLIMSFKNIAWASVNKQGSVIEVNITEFTPELESDAPCNIVAKYDAVIKKIDVSKGSVNVKIGDTVSKNQILVSGVVGYGAGNSFVHSKGKIIAEVRLSETIKINKNQIHSKPTGEKCNRFLIDVMSIKIPLYLGSVHGDYEIKKSNNYVDAFGGKIPIKIYKNEYIFNSKTKITITKEDAQNLAFEKLKLEFKNAGVTELKASIISENENNDEYIFKYNVVCLMDIGMKSLLEIE